MAAPPVLPSAEDVRATAAMARLALSETECAQMAAELGRILDYAAAIQELDLTGVEPLMQPFGWHQTCCCPLREDRVGDHLPPAAALANAPVTAGDYFVVPAVLGEAGGPDES